MKRPILTSLLSLSALCCTASLGVAEDASNPAEASYDNSPIIIHRRIDPNESLPDLGARLYDRIDYELKLRKLTRDIRVAEAELDVQREQLRVYDKYFGRTSALRVTRQNARLDVVKSEENLKVLRHEKLLALRYRNDQIRFRSLLIMENAVRVRVAE